ncbi:hypothetical protein GOP47_0014864 [Adiantum capillus-veneris]|uniref:Uncharacterized protein n=1 Tax=Adiantum capillus-veneris TaxID=13818 RepID=A0A9D4UMD1_ADICA|nr:hypothetical protein GOP47_0014864 [Adiantum capillus-veneris]
MTSHRSSSSSSSAARKGDDDGKPAKLSFHEMLSYGHKPWDEDYREQKKALNEAFTQAQRQAAAEEKRMSKQKKMSTKQAKQATSFEDADVHMYGVEPVKFTDKEMLSYGHKPWDKDYHEWKDTYEKPFTKAERHQAAVEARSEKRASKRGNT